MIDERQQNILKTIVLEYIDSADPVSSQSIEEKYDLGISSATIRCEMKRLTDEKFLLQPHTSAGRIPTDKGYRFFVDKFLEEESEEDKFKIEQWLQEEIDSVRLISLITKNMASICCGLTLGYLPERNLLWREGWEDILKEPEFERSEYASIFADFLKEVENKIPQLEYQSEIKIYIGKNPFSKLEEFSVISSNCFFPKNKKGILAIVGPKRMDYNKNLSLMNSILRTLENY